jgi:hypothetical protein
MHCYGGIRLTISSAHSLASAPVTVPDNMAGSRDRGWATSIWPPAVCFPASISLFLSLSRRAPEYHTASP